MFLNVISLCLLDDDCGYHEMNINDVNTVGIENISNLMVEWKPSVKSKRF